MVHKLIQYAWLVWVYVLMRAGRSRRVYQGGEPIIPGDKLTFIPALAKALGSEKRAGENRALVIQKVWEWMCFNEQSGRRDHFIDGRWWTYNSIREWHEKHFDWLSESRVKAIFQDLKKMGILIGRQQRRDDQRLWYSIDFAVLEGYLKESQGGLKRVPAPDSIKSGRERKSPTSKKQSTKGNLNRQPQSANSNSSTPAPVTLPPADVDDVSGTDPETGEIAVESPGEAAPAVSHLDGDGRDDGKLSPSKPVTPPPVPAAPSPAAVLLAGQGVNEPVLSVLVAQYSEMEIVQAVAHARRQKQIDNPPGWIVDCLRFGWHTQPVQARASPVKRSRVDAAGERYVPGQWDEFLKS